MDKYIDSVDTEKLAAWKFGPRENAAAAETAYEAARARLAGSQCGK